MHQPVIGGKITNMEFDDAAKRITITSQPANDEVWKLVKDGFCSGYSIGGKYVGKTWDDPDEPAVKRFTIDPVEVSYVDNPCLSTAVFTSVKAGQSVQHAFKSATPSEPTNDEVFAEAGRIVGVGGEITDDVLKSAREGLRAKGAATASALVSLVKNLQPDLEPEVGTAAAEDAPAAVPAAEEPAQPEDWGINQVFQVAADKSVHATKAAAKAHVAASQTLLAGNSPLAAQLRAALTKAKAADKPYGNVEYADPGYQDDKKKRYPVDTPTHIRAAWNYINKPKNAGKYSDEQVSHIKDAIIAAWKDKIDKDGPPSAEKMAAFGDAGAVAKALNTIGAKVEGVAVAKGLYTVSSLASFVNEFQYLLSNVCWEEEWENDKDSSLPSDGAAILHALGTYLVEMATEEVAEMIADLMSRDVEIPTMTGDPDDDAIVVELAAAAIDCVKADTALVQKIGARNSKKDKAALQAIHDHAQAMGAKCDAGNVDKSVTPEVIKAVTAERDELAAVVKEALPEIAKMGEQVTKLAADLEAANAQIAKLNEQPAPMPVIAQGTRVVDKTVDTATGQTVAPVEPGALEALLKGLTSTPAGLKMLQDAAFDAAMSKPLHASVGGLPST